MSSTEYAEWRAFDLLEPLGDKRDDYRAAMICTVLANLNRDPEKTPEPYKLEDFLLKFTTDFGEDDDGEEEFHPKYTTQELWQGLRAWALLTQIQHDEKKSKRNNA